MNGMGLRDGENRPTQCLVLIFTSCDVFQGECKGEECVMGYMGMFIIGLFCMVFYLLLIIHSVFQTEWFSEALGGAQKGGRDDGSKRLPAITSSVGREGIPGIYNSLLFFVLCNGAMSTSVQYHNFDEWGIGLKVVEESWSCIRGGIWGIGGGCMDISVIFYGVEPIVLCGVERIVLCGVNRIVLYDVEQIMECISTERCWSVTRITNFEAGIR